MKSMDTRVGVRVLAMLPFAIGERGTMCILGSIKHLRHKNDTACPVAFLAKRKEASFLNFRMTPNAALN